MLKMKAGKIPTFFFNEPFPKASGRTKHFACLVLQDKDQVTVARIRAMIRRTGGDWRLSTSEFKSHVSIFMEVSNFLKNICLFVFLVGF